MKRRLIPVILAALMLISAAAVFPVGADKITPGDVNDDGRINNLDIRLLQQHAANEFPMDFFEEAADLNNDGKVNVKDIDLLMKKVIDTRTFSANPTFESDYKFDPVALFVGDVEIDQGTTSATLPVTVGSLPQSRGLSSVAFKVSVSGRAAVEKVECSVDTAVSMFSDDKFIMVDNGSGIFEEDTEIARITLRLSPDAKPGEYFNVTLSTSTDIDDAVTFKKMGKYLVGVGAIVARHGKITVSSSGEPEPPAPYGKVTLSAADVTVEKGTSTADVIVTVGNIPADLGLASCRFTAETEEAKIIAVEQLVSSGYSDYSDREFSWADFETGIHTTSAQIAKITVELPADAKAGEEFAVTLGASDINDNYLAFGDASVAYGAEVIRNAVIKVVSPGGPTAEPKGNEIAFSSTSIIGTPGETVDVDICVEGLDPDLGLSSFYLYVSVPGTAVRNVELLCAADGDSILSQIEENGVLIKWESRLNGVLGKARAALARVYVEIPSDAVSGTVFPILIEPISDPDNFLTAGKVNGEKIGQNATAVDGAKVVVGKTPLAPGDANGDGKLNARDVTAIMKAIITEGSARGAFPNEFYRKAADFNADSKLNARDVVAVMKKIIASK